MRDDRPAWWCYPLCCSQGHEWKPGTIRVGWTACPCAGGLGHRRVNCAEPGCRSAWYSPRHDPKVKPAGYPVPVRGSGS